MSKAYILVVEDEALIYRRLKKMLVKENYQVAAYTPSVLDAVAEINKKRPDIVLLDIQLQGEQTGLDLGKLLYEEYQIPFIYVTSFDDNETFFKAINTHQAHYFVKTKPRLNSKELLRVIQTALFNNKPENTVPIHKENIIGYVDYIQETKNLGNSVEHQKTVLLNEVSFFTTNSKKLDKEKTKLQGKNCYVKLKANYVRFEDWQEKSLYLPYSLKKVYARLPQYFVQISDMLIINLLPGELTGILNGSKIKVKNTVYPISDTYKDEVQKRLDSLYLTPKNLGDTS